MAFLDLKALKQNKGAKLKLTLQSTGTYQQKTFNGQSFNIFDYEVLQDNKPYTLGASDALHRKLQQKLGGLPKLMKKEEVWGTMPQHRALQSMVGV
mgnify:CR=1 FL=1